MGDLSDANVIKALLIDHFNNNGLINGSLLGSELFCGSKKRQTDLLIVNKFTTVIEIKSKNDDFRRLREQLDDYKRIFDFQYLVTTTCHSRKVLPILKDDEGLILLNEKGEFNTIRTAKRIYNQDKFEILETIPLSFLKQQNKLISITNYKKGIRGILENKKIEELRSLLLMFLKERLELRNEAFRNERGTSTHFEDIRFLSSRIADEISI